MDMLDALLIAAAAAAAAAGLSAALLSRRRERRTMETLDKMLDAAMDGSFSETAFDESMLSAVETKLAHYLAASEKSARSLGEEREKIKELISDISHQTKTPIANILLYAQLLKEQPLTIEGEACAAELNAQAEKLSFLIGALVKTSRLEAGILAFSPKENDIAPMIDDAAAQVMPRAEKKGIALGIEPTKATAAFDAKWTAEAVYNLLDNAVKYTPKGGHIGVKTVEYELFCRIDVSDTGMGVSEEEQARIFARFYRAPEAAETEGVGIGLYLTRQIIAGQGGYLRVSSKKGEGATFSIFLPKK